MGLGALPVNLWSMGLPHHIMKDDIAPARCSSCDTVNPGVGVAAIATRYVLADTSI